MPHKKPNLGRCNYTVTQQPNYYEMEVDTWRWRLERENYIKVSQTWRVFQVEHMLWLRVWGSGKSIGNLPMYGYLNKRIKLKEGVQAYGTKI